MYINYESIDEFKSNCNDYNLMDYNTVSYMKFELQYKATQARLLEDERRMKEEKKYNEMKKRGDSNG